jgi:predicted metalloprotease with PDZ domain
VKRDNRIVLSKVAVKGRLNREGELQAWELVQVDRGSVVEKMGFRPADLVTTVNGIRARDFNDERQSLESSDRFKVTIVRKGKARNLIVEIR